MMTKLQEEDLLRVEKSFRVCCSEFKTIKYLYIYRQAGFYNM
jgi:hypothetical protein